MQDNRPKDPLINFRTTILGKNSKGGERIQLYIGGELASRNGQDPRGNAAVEELIAALQDSLTNEKGVKLDIHVNKKETEDGRTFLSGFAFVKPVTDKTAAPAPKKFVPVSGGVRTSKLNKTIA